MIVAAGTVVSSLFSGKIIDRFGVAAVTTVSVGMTALALMGYSYSHHFGFLCLLAIPLGLGAGSVDAALNNYVALHYQARHMNWLHSFWGVGAAIGPMIMAGHLAKGESWSEGYHTVAWIQLALVLILLASLPLWIRKKTESTDPAAEKSPGIFALVAKLPGLKQALAVFFCYCTIEATFGLWGASYLVFERGLEADQAARLVSLYFLGITLGRFLSGFLTSHFSNRQLVYLGQGWVARRSSPACSTRHLSTLEKSIPKPSWVCRWPAPMWASRSCLFYSGKYPISPVTAFCWAFWGFFWC